MLPRTVGHYVIGDCIGTGGNGEVYQAHDTHLDRRVAIKVVREQHLQSTGTRRRLRQEALAAASLDHPFLCKVYELTEVDGYPAIVMEYLEGETLADRLERGRMELADLYSMATGIAEALGAAHARGLVHRDVKPSNVMLTHDGHVKVLDFGIAKELGDLADDDSTTLTVPGTVIGTPRFMSPEQAQGTEVDARSDVFSLGIVLYFACSGRYPFVGDRPQEYLGHLVSGQPVALDADIAPELAAILQRCLAKDPDERYADGGELARALRAAAGSSMTQPPQGLERLSAVARIAIAAGAISAGVAIGAVVLRPQPAEAPPLVGTPTPIATSANRERDVRIDPTGQWYSYLSGRIDSSSIWLARADGGEALRVEGPTGTITGHVWSADGAELAYVIALGDERYLQVMPMTGGAARMSVPLGPSNRSAVRPVRWTESGIYLQRGSRLERIDPATRELTLFAGPWERLRIREADILPDDSRLVLAAIDSDGQRDLWLADIVTGELRQLTNDATRESSPRWWGTSGREIAFVSTRAGGRDAWRLDLESGVSVPVLGLQGAVERVEVAADGSRLFAATTTEAADLHRLDADGALSVVAADSRREFSGSIAEDAGIVAVQREKPRAVTGLAQFDAEIAVGSWSHGALGSDARVVVPDGFDPHLSADGTSLAYLRNLSLASSSAQLWVRDLALQEDRLVADKVLITGFSDAPFAWASDTWSWAGNDLVYVAIEDGKTSKAHRTPSRGTPGAPFASVSGWPRETLASVHPTRDGRAVAYQHSVFGASETIHVARGASTNAIVTLEDVDVQVVGWTHDDTALLLLEFPRGDADGMANIVRLDLNGSMRRPGQLDGIAHRGNVVSDPWGARLVWTRRVDGVDDLWTFDLDTGSARRLTSNARPSTTFSGVNFLRDRSLVFTTHERTVDVWALRF